jgi:CxxC motif-containing protein (DUF1111 family)
MMIFAKRKYRSRQSLLRLRTWLLMVLSVFWVGAAQAALIQAEDYTAFSDTTPGNAGGAYRSDNVDIEPTTDTGGGFNVGYTEAGEFLQYTLTLPAGTYAVATRVASAIGGGAYTLLLNGATIGGNTVANTGGWQSFQTQIIGNVTVTGSPQTLRLNVTAAGFNINWIDLTPVSTNGTNLAIGAIATASTVLQPASLAIDGSTATRWESNHGVDPSSLTIDLRNSVALARVVVVWEAANAANYVVQGSNDNSTWTPLASVTGGAFGERTNTHDVAGSYRYVRMLGTTRSSPYGYSIREMQIFGSSAPITDSDRDGVPDSADQCPGTPAGTPVGSNGCPVGNPDQDGDGVPDNLDQCPGTPAGTSVDDRGCPVVVNPNPSITPLYNSSTPREPNTQFDRGDALVTRFSDRPRTRHAREDEFQSYDHYIKFYFENRASNIEIVDYVAKGGTTLEMNVRTIFPLHDLQAENRWWFIGQTTVAQYAGNGTMAYLGFDGTYYNYRKTDNVNRQFNRPIQIGDRLEFEISQFSREDIPRGQANYYGTVFLYVVGEGIVPWYTQNGTSFPEDSRKIPEEYWLGGKTTIHYQYSNEPNDHFLQMATNLGYGNAQKFLLGRRAFHSSSVTGRHDEDQENGVYDVVNGTAGTKYINERCSSCHERNGAAQVAPVGQSLDRWVFKLSDANGNADPSRGRVLQSKGSSGEGTVSISSWTTVGPLRRPNFQFSTGTPARFSARLAPRLVGLGLLEAIPESTILARQDPNDTNGDGISGRANVIPDPANPSLSRLGRFGWKASTTSVRHQVAAALNTDMGVRTSLLPNPDCGPIQTNCGGTSRMLADLNMNELTLYLQALGVRPQRGIETGTVNTTINSGKSLFTSTGCAACHTETVTTSAFHPLTEVRSQTIHPYTDLLLHDMGDGLADTLTEGQATGREWRTTPLWGLGLQACVTGGVVNPTGREGGEVCAPHHGYLHDGRARSIEEAILWHGGEAAGALSRYQALSATQKQNLLRFLEAL